MRQRQRSRSRQKQEDITKMYIDIYNLPEHGNKDDISFFLFKALEKCRAIIKHTTPIIKSEMIEEFGCLRLFFRSREQILNCLDLNGIYYGQKSFYMKSPLSMRLIPQIHIANDLNIRRISPKVQEGFNKLCILNLPSIKQFQVINFLAQKGQLKAFQPVYEQKGKAMTHCFFSYHKNDDAESCLTELNGKKLRSKQINIKRAALMINESKKPTISKSKPKSYLFEKDLHSHFLTFDTIGFFKSMKISCILLLKNIISSQSEKQFVKQDIMKQVEKIGPVTKLVSKQKNVYIEYQKVEYAQICYLLLINRKYDGKNIDVSFYDPLNFADDILI